MTTLAELAEDVGTLVTTVFDSVSGLTWAEVDGALGTNFRVPPGEARVQILASLASQTGDSNANYLEAEVVLKIAYRRTSDADQTTWLETELQTIGAALVPPSAWRGLDAVHEVVGGPESGIPERVGNVVFHEIAVRVQLALAP